tara:strand:- start:1604 stop:1852 length:249 start_codon:yes stop_codon:yes gene_type:complete
MRAPVIVRSDLLERVAEPATHAEFHRVRGHSIHAQDHDVLFSLSLDIVRQGRYLKMHAFGCYNRRETASDSADLTECVVSPG